MADNFKVKDIGLAAWGRKEIAIAAAAWSWVEKMLQLVQVTSAPSDLSVSISTAVSIVMCRQPATRAPFSGFLPLYSVRIDIRPGISFSAIEISFRPSSARLMSLTLYAGNSLRASMFAPVCGGLRVGMLLH